VLIEAIKTIFFGKRKSNSGYGGENLEEACKRLIHERATLGYWGYLTGKDKKLEVEIDQIFFLWRAESRAEWSISNSGAETIEGCSRAFRNLTNSDFTDTWSNPGSPRYIADPGKSPLDPLGAIRVGNAGHPDVFGKFMNRFGSCF
jgi:hypothetical protein